MNNLDKIKQLLSSSELKQDEQDELYVLFSAKSDVELEPVFALFSEDPGFIKTISQNFIAKRKAIADDDPGAWQTVLQNEVKQLEQLS